MLKIRAPGGGGSFRTEREFVAAFGLQRIHFFSDKIGIFAIRRKKDIFALKHGKLYRLKTVIECDFRGFFKKSLIFVMLISHNIPHALWRCRNIFTRCPLFCHRNFFLRPITIDNYSPRALASAGSPVSRSNSESAPGYRPTLLIGNRRNNALPSIIFFGTGPQTRESELWARLSPMTKYCPSSSVRDKFSCLGLFT